MSSLGRSRNYRILEKLGGDGIGWTAGTQTQWWMNMTIDDGRPFTDDMKRVVAQQKLAFVATVCPDGTPNLSPKGTIAVWDDTHLVFADIRSPGTVANLKLNPFAVTDVQQKAIHRCLCLGI